MQSSRCRKTRTDVKLVHIVCISYSGRVLDGDVRAKEASKRPVWAALRAGTEHSLEKDKGKATTWAHIPRFSCLTSNLVAEMLFGILLAGLREDLSALI